MTKISKDELMQKIRMAMKKIFSENGYVYENYLIKLLLVDSKEKTVKSALFYENPSLSMEEVMEAEKAAITKAQSDFVTFWLENTKNIFNETGNKNDKFN